MTSLGKRIRIERIIDRNTGKTVIVPMDHGMTLGPISGIKNIASTVMQVAKGKANAIVIHKGLVNQGHRQSGNDIGLIVHMSASTGISISPNSKFLICTVEEAVKFGADAVSVHVNLGNVGEARMMSDFGKVARDAYHWGMPLFAMIYVRGRKIKNESGVAEVKHAARVAAEMGADLIKVSYTGTSESFHEVVNGCSVPIVIAGGNRFKSDRLVLKMVKDAMDAGAIGVSIGRNVFQHDEPVKMVRSISSIVHDGSSISEAMEFLI